MRQLKTYLMEAVVLLGLVGLFEYRYAKAEDKLQVPDARRSVSATAGDFDGDKNLDVIVATTYNQNRPKDGTKYGSLYFLRGDGKGNLEKPYLIAEVEGASKGIAITSGDLDNDGDLDLIVVAADYSKPDADVSIWINDGKGNFTLKTEEPK
ncbi:VCBS repeat-containing protein [Candidatus Woesearchaeota archaeon]|nr:VCBS repeat-containing protein [Candidatus Woesearchaeota archaeon]